MKLEMFRGTKPLLAKISNFDPQIALKQANIFTHLNLSTDIYAGYVIEWELFRSSMSGRSTLS